jgi:hypothetical protein
METITLRELFMIADGSYTSQEIKEELNKYIVIKEEA